jgi:hypothetical protein
VIALPFGGWCFQPDVEVLPFDEERKKMGDGDSTCGEMNYQGENL